MLCIIEAMFQGPIDDESPQLALYFYTNLELGDDPDNLGKRIKRRIWFNILSCT